MDKQRAYIGDGSLTLLKKEVRLMPVTYEALALVATFGMLLLALLSYLDNKKK